MDSALEKSIESKTSIYITTVKRITWDFLYLSVVLYTCVCLQTEDDSGDEAESLSSGSHAQQGHHCEVVINLCVSDT